MKRSAEAEWACAERDLSGAHDLQSGIEPADRGRDVASARIVQIDHPASGLLGRDEIERAQHVIAQIPVAPEHRHRCRFRLPRLDLVGDGPERAGLEPFQLVVVAEQLRRVFHIRPAGDVLAIVLSDGAAHDPILVATVADDATSTGLRSNRQCAACATAAP